MTLEACWDRAIPLTQCVEILWSQVKFPWYTGWAILGVIGGLVVVFWVVGAVFAVIEDRKRPVEVRRAERKAAFAEWWHATRTTAIVFAGIVLLAAIADFLLGLSTRR